MISARSAPTSTRSTPWRHGKIAQALLLAGDSLSLFPMRGRVGLEPGTRELVAVRPYVLVHEAKDAEVVILAVWHGAQER